MPSNKWKKHLAADVGSIRRPRGSRRPGSSILIVTEGEITEPIYFDRLKRILSLQTLEVEVLPAGTGDPRRLVEAALAQRQKRRKDAKAGKLGFSKAMDFDELWIVFDTDVPLEHGRYHDGIGFASAKGVKSAESSPCFEYWLLLHLVYTTTPMERFADVKPVLERAMKQKYAKNSREAAKLIPPLLKNLDDAMKRAAKVRQHQADAGSSEPANPSTEVDRLISAIKAAAPPANL